MARLNTLVCSICGSLKIRQSGSELWCARCGSTKLKVGKQAGKINLDTAVIVEQEVA
jgi:hypothetical protein